MCCFVFCVVVFCLCVVWCFISSSFDGGLLLVCCSCVVCPLFVCFFVVCLEVCAFVACSLFAYRGFVVGYSYAVRLMSLCCRVNVCCLFCSLVVSCSFCCWFVGLLVPFSILAGGFHNLHHNIVMYHCSPPPPTPAPFPTGDKHNNAWQATPHSKRTLRALTPSWFANGLDEQIPGLQNVATSLHMFSASSLVCHGPAKPVCWHPHHGLPTEESLPPPPSPQAKRMASQLPRFKSNTVVMSSWSLREPELVVVCQMCSQSQGFCGGWPKQGRLNKGGVKHSPVVKL